MSPPIAALEAIAIAASAFAATNIDDLFLLAAWFGSGRLPARHIVAGQFLGIGALVAAGAAAAVAALAIPSGWTSLLGLLPLLLGIRAALQLRSAGGDTDEEDNNAAAALSGRANVLAVAGVTLANGGDNLAVYIPLFTGKPFDILIYAAVFAAMTALWCWAGYALVRHPAIGGRIKRWGHIVMPAVLVALGLYLLSGAMELLH